jgi:mevalonate kinase
MNKSKSFYSKILLFGEYSVILDSKALATPYQLFQGQLTFKKSDDASPSNQELLSLVRFLKDHKQKSRLNFDLDLTSLEFDIGQGLFFDSTIPQGFGVGSSGALCAAVFYHYTKYQENYFNDKILELKGYLSQIESHFHGASSGIDPLISYLNKTILIKSKTEMGIIDLPSYSAGDGALFLLNTKRPRRTEPLVNLFLEKCKVNSFNQFCEKILIPATNGCIDAFMEKDIPTFIEFFREISDFQLRHLTPMIPTLYQDLWLKGLDQENFYLKLCGAGGGGFLLGMAKNFNQAKLDLKDYEIRPLFYF